MKDIKFWIVNLASPNNMKFMVFAMTMALFLAGNQVDSPSAGSGIGGS